MGTSSTRSRDTPVWRRLGGYLISALLHLLLLLLLASWTLTTDGGNFGFGLNRGTAVQVVDEQQSIDDVRLNRLVEDTRVQPLKVQKQQREQVRLPQLASFSAPKPSAELLASVETRYTPESGAVGGLVGEFGSFIGSLRRRGLDVVLVIDATASMQHVLDELKARAGGLVDRIQSLVPVARVGVVAFRDRGDEFVTRWSDLSFHGSKIRAFLDGLNADGGGDYEEAVLAGLETAVDELSWRKRSERVIVIVGSSPPHAEDVPAIAALTREFREAGGTVSTIDLTQRMHEEYQRKVHRARFGTDPETIGPLPDFYQEVRQAYRVIARDGGGNLASLGSDQALTEQILTFAFGTKWRQEVARHARGSSR